MSGMDSFEISAFKISEYIIYTYKLHESAIHNLMLMNNDIKIFRLQQLQLLVSKDFWKLIWKETGSKRKL